jgi:hypothetical protein
VKDTYSRVWPDALRELSDKYVSKEPVALWYRDESLDFIVTSIQRNPEGDRIELARKEVTAVIFTRNGSDDIDLSFYSKG